MQKLGFLDQCQHIQCFPLWPSGRLDETDITRNLTRTLDAVIYIMGTVDPS